MTTRMPQVLGSATLETMTTAQNRAVLADAEERALRAAPATAEEVPGPDEGWDEPDDTTGSYALEARGALRRVAGLSTELADVTEVEYRRLRLERVVLVGGWTEGTQADVDRTALILDIFAQHASSREGKAQVELAQMQYMLPRLRGWGESLSRQAGGRVAGGGGIGTRGPGETKIETDRRRINTRIAKLRRQLSGLGATRSTQRQERVRQEVPSVVLAGYTNAGKSSLLNRLTGAGVLVEDALFATLDPTVRRSRTPDGREYTIADTVGFVRHLPHQLVEAFRSTLEEVADSDLILHVVDGSDADPEGQIAAVREVLGEIDALHVPELLVVNKCDAAHPVTLTRLRP